MGLTIAIPTIGRPTLARTLFSFIEQLEPGDEVIFVADPKGDPEYVHTVYNLGSNRLGVNWVFKIQGGEGGWGQAQRNYARKVATPGNHIWSVADDDIVTPNALSALRTIKSGWALFRVGRGSDAPWLWQDKRVYKGNLDADSILAPAGHLDAQWGLDYEGDAKFALALQAELGEPWWGETVVAVAKPNAEYLEKHYQGLALAQATALATGDYGLRDWHDARGFDCVAHSEGQHCCVDLWLEGRR